jgi:menaquinone-dependent protoporphyrinogen oxidase
MPATLLVTWATRYGSTEEVAHAIADDLLRQGLAVNAQPMRDVRSLDRYNAIVLGCALYMGRLHKDARHFLASHRAELMQRPVALFVLGPIHADAKEFAEAEKQMKKELAKFPWFSPASQQVIGGRFDPERFGFPFNILPALRKIPANDARDWTAIHSWAGNLPTALRPSINR